VLALSHQSTEQWRVDYVGAVVCRLTARYWRDVRINLTSPAAYDDWVRARNHWDYFYNRS